MKKLLLAHGEKIGMGLVLLVAGLVIYSSIGLDKLPPDKSPDRINAVAQQVSTKVSASTWENAKQDAADEIKLYTPLAAGGQQKITSATYAVDSGGWDRAIVPPSTLRRDPALLAPVDFEGAGITGLFAFMSEEMQRKIALDMAREAAERERDMRTERENSEREAARGRPGRTGPGMAEGGFFAGGIGEIDPNNKKIREVGVTMRPAGVQLSGAELIEQMSCAVVVGKVPMTEQLAEYKRALAEARGYKPDVDFPNYLGYIVQRAEVVPGKELTEKDWVNVRIRNGKTGGAPLAGVTEATIPMIMADWISPQPDLHDERYTHPLLTLPQPPLVGRDWGDMARHSEVQLATEVDPEDLTDEVEDPAIPDGTDPDALFTARGNPGTGPGAFGEGPARGNFGAGRFGGGGYGGEYGGEGGMMRGEGGFRGGGEMGGYGGGGGSYVPRAYTPKFNEAGEIELEVPFFMFRFFDLSVAPGRRYKYRIRLAMSDVNGNQMTANLDPEVIERLKGKKPNPMAVRYTDWSEPTPTISIPQAGVIMVAEAKPPTTSAASEVTAKLVVESYGVDPENRNQAIQAYITADARRGSVMNFFGQEVEKLIQQGRYIEKVEDFNIDTGITVLDIDGGDRYTRDMNSPANVLFMDPTGRMYLRDELDDERDVAYHKAVFNPPKRPGGMGGGMEYGPEGGGRGRGGRGGGEGGFFRGE